MAAADIPNPEPNPHPFDFGTALLARTGHAALWSADGRGVVVLTVGGIEAGAPVERQVAFHIEEWDALVAFVDRMRQRSGWAHG